MLCRAGGWTRTEYQARGAAATPRGIGGAVVRNRARRLIKEAWAAVAGGARPGFRVVVVGRPEIREASAAEVREDLARVLADAGVLE